MAAVASTPNAQHATGQKEKSKAYDPLKVAEGMLNGAITRIALTLRDPKQYGKATPAVLASTAKLYQDALDDVEIQILEVKWLLEQRLADNKKKREAAEKIIETASAAASPAAKRKQDGSDGTALSPPKRARSELRVSPETEAFVVKPSDSPAPTKLLEVPSTSTRPSPQPEANKGEDNDSMLPTDNKQKDQQVRPDPSPLPDQPFDVDDFARPSNHGTPAHTNEEMDMFDSMFGDPDDLITDAINANSNDDAMNFEFDDAPVTNNDEAVVVDQTDTSKNDFSQLQDPAQSQPLPQDSMAQSSLENILPGLEQYAGQTDDAAQAGQDGNANNPFTASFEPNIFDEFLSDTNMGDALAIDPDADFSNIDVGNPDATFDFDELFGVE